MKKKLNIAVMGPGFMGKLHSHMWRTVPKLFDVDYEPVLKVVFGTVKEDTEAFAANWGFEEWSMDWQKVIERDDIDIVDIVTPTFVHKDIAVYAASHGKNIFCEKPCAFTSADCMEMYEAVKKNGVLSYLNHNYRRVPAVSFAKQMIDDGLIGDIYHFRGAYLQDWIMDPDFPLTWHLQKKYAGAGPLFDLGTHNVDLARFLVGEVSSVYADMRTFIKERPLPGKGAATFSAGTNASSEKGKVDIEDACFMTLEFKDKDTLGSCEVTRFAGGRRNYNYFEIYGSKGSLHWSQERMDELNYIDLTEPTKVQGFRNIIATDGAHPYEAKWWPSGHIVGYDATFVNAASDFLKALKDGTEVKPNFLDGYEIMKVMEAAIKSAETGSKVYIKD